MKGPSLGRSALSAPPKTVASQPPQRWAVMPAWALKTTCCARTAASPPTTPPPCATPCTSRNRYAPAPPRRAPPPPAPRPSRTASIAARRVHHPGHGTALLQRGDLVRNLGNALLAQCAGRDMGRDGDPGMAPERMVG